jgi:hypothetical protein
MEEKAMADLDEASAKRFRSVLILLFHSFASPSFVLANPQAILEDYWKEDYSNGEI